MKLLFEMSSLWFNDFREIWFQHVLTHKKYYNIYQMNEETENEKISKMATELLYNKNSWKRRYNEYNGTIFLPDGLMRQMLGKQLMSCAKPGNLELPGDV